MDFDLPPDLVDYLAQLDDFIEREIKPLQAQDDNERFFDHRREDAHQPRHAVEKGGLAGRDLQQGMRVKAAYEVKDGRNVARVIEAEKQ